MTKFKSRQDCVNQIFSPNAFLFFLLDTCKKFGKKRKKRKNNSVEFMEFFFFKSAYCCSSLLTSADSLGQILQESCFVFCLAAAAAQLTALCQVGSHKTRNMSRHLVGTHPICIVSRQGALHTAHWILCTAHCILKIAHCTLHTANYTLHTKPIYQARESSLVPHCLLTVHFLQKT